MYQIHSIIWGIPITRDMCDQFQEEALLLEEDSEEWQNFPAAFGEEDGGWFTTLYSGESPHEVGYLGDCVCEYPCYDPPSHEEIDRKKESLSEKRKEEILEEIRKLPSWLKNVMPSPGWYTVASTS